MQRRASEIDDVLQRVRSEYLEMPGLRLTVAQAARLLSLDDSTCTRLLDALVEASFLTRTADGLYVRPGSPQEHFEPSSPRAVQKRDGRARAALITQGGVMAEGDLRLIERRRRRTEAEAERRLIAQAIGGNDDEAVQDLRIAGYRADTIVLLELAPLVQVAWADGSVSERERELLLRIAAREHVKQNSPAHAQLSAWLECPPSPHLFNASVRAIGRIVASLQPEVGAALRRKVIHDCGTIAAATGGSLYVGRCVSDEEQQVIRRIATALS